MAVTTVNTTDTFEQWRVKANLIGTFVGDHTNSSSGDNLNTSASNLLAAINEIIATPTFTGNINLTARSEIRFQDAAGGQYVGFEAPATVSSNVMWVLPAADGSANQHLKTDGSGNLGWVTPPSSGVTALNNATANELVTVGATTTELDAESNLTFDGSTLAVTGAVTVSTTLGVTGVTTLSEAVNLLARAELRFQDAAGGQYVGFEAPATVSSNVMWVLPAADGTNGQMLSTNGSGTLAWAAASSTVTGLTDVTISSIASGEILKWNGSAWINNTLAEAGIGTAALTGSTNNEIVTVTGANAIQGEANLSFDGSSLMVTDQSAFTPLGRIHVRGGTSGASAVEATGNEIVIEENGDCGMSILSGTANTGNIVFGDSDDSDIGMIRYHHNGNSLRWTVNAAERMQINTDGRLGVGVTPSDGHVHIHTTLNTTSLFVKNTNASAYVAAFRAGGTGTTPAIAAQNSSNNDTFTVGADGDCENANNSYGSLSDRKLKKDIVDATSQWDDIKAIRVRNFTKIDDPNNVRQLGVVAQELEAAEMSGLVIEKPDTEETWNDEPVLDEHGNAVLDDEGKPMVDRTQVTRTDLGTITKSVKYSVLYMKAIKALQEAMTRIETLEQEVAVLKG